MAEDWSMLPVDLLADIVMKLETWEDFLYFSVVCRFWNYVSGFIKHEWRPTATPWLLLTENNEDNPSHIRKIFNLTYMKCYNFCLPETFGARCLGSAYGWVALIQRDLTLQLFNPITKAQIRYPSLEPLIIPYVYPNFDKNSEIFMNLFLTGMVMKLVVIKVPRGDHEEFVIVAFNHRCLFYVRLGDQSWTVVLHEEITLDIGDIVVMDDHVFALYYNGAIIYWNVMEFYGPEAVKPLEYCPGQPVFIVVRGIDKMYLVQSGSDLLMVLRVKEGAYTEYRTSDFKVFILDTKNKSWEEIKDLGDVALFVGNNSSMSISEASAKGLQCGIYFTDDENERWSVPKEFGGHDMGVYDFKSRKILPFYKGDDTLSHFCPSTWFII